MSNQQQPNQQPDLPPGWTLCQGAGGWYARHATRSGWATCVYCDSAKEGAGKPRAIAAAWKFVDSVGKVLAERERMRAALRTYLTKE